MFFLAYVGFEDKDKPKDTSHDDEDEPTHQHPGMVSQDYLSRNWKQRFDS